ncbi:hypothetical protein BGZ63DRAFT_392443 [Mariannaea sp. PMI_226]|nr:hypothetical protein BGZ63DRAFT_392443 [Mariannaea sp. PMI_226]
MGCTCRVAPLRFFVQGLSQVHRFETPSFLRYRSTSTTPLSNSGTRQSRLLHASRYLKQDANNNGNMSSESSGEPASIGSTTSEPPSVKESQQEASGPSESIHSTEPLDPTENTKATENDRSGNDRSGTNRMVKRARWAEKPWLERPRGPAMLGKPKPTKYTGPLALDFNGPSVEEPKQDKPLWKIQKEALKEKFPEGWNPRKRLSPDALAGIRALNAQFPDVYTTSTLASRFEVSPENIRRILKSKWQPNSDEERRRQDRWYKRGMQIWDQQAAIGIKPPRKWRLEGITRDSDYHVRRQAAIRRNRSLDEQDDREVRANMRGQSDSSYPRNSSFSGNSFSSRPSSNRQGWSKPSDKPRRF